MNDTTLGIIVNMKENVTSTTKGVNQSMGSLSDTMADNRMKMRELGMGVSYMSMTMLGLGVAMQQTNNQFLKTTGSTLAWIGGIGMGISGAVQFISAISKVIDALKSLQIAEMLSQAFSGPAGWAMLLGGAAVAGGIYYGVTRSQSAEAKVAKSDAKSTTVNNITIHNQGSLYAQQDLISDIQKGLIQTQQRTSTTGIK